MVTSAMKLRHLLLGRKAMTNLDSILKSRVAAWGGLTNSWENKRGEKQRRKERYNHLNAEFQRIARRDKKAFLMISAKK